MSELMAILFVFSIGSLIVAAMSLSVWCVFPMQESDFYLALKNQHEQTEISLSLYREIEGD